MQARPDAAREYGLPAIAPSARRRDRDDRRSTSASATPRSSTTVRPGTRSSRSWRRRAWTRSRSRRPSRSSTRRCWPRWRARRSSSACSTSVDHTVETPDIVAERIRRALPHVPAERIVVAPDCGMKYLPRDCRLREDAGDGGRRRDRPGRGGADWLNSDLSEVTTPRCGQSSRRALTSAASPARAGGSSGSGTSPSRTCRQTWVRRGRIGGDAGLQLSGTVERGRGRSPITGSRGGDGQEAVCRPEHVDTPREHEQLAGEGLESGRRRRLGCPVRRARTLPSARRAGPPAWSRRRTMGERWSTASSVSVARPCSDERLDDGRQARCQGLMRLGRRLLRQPR